MSMELASFGGAETLQEVLDNAALGYFADQFSKKVSVFPLPHHFSCINITIFWCSPECKVLGLSFVTVFSTIMQTFLSTLNSTAVYPMYLRLETTALGEIFYNFVR